MKIQREINGRIVEFELTSEEVYAAYLKKEHEYDRCDVINLLEQYNYSDDTRTDFAKEYGVSFEKVYGNNDLIDEIAYEKRHQQDKYDLNWDVARDEAFKDVLYDHFKALGIVESKESSAKDSDGFGLPDACYSTLPNTGELIVVGLHEPGYIVSDFSTDSEEQNRAFADAHNSKNGISMAQEKAMVAGSMFGWDAPAADPRNYDVNGQLLSYEDQKVSMDYKEMKNLFKSINNARGEHVTGYIVFDQSSFTASYTEQQRTYAISSDNKAFNSKMGGYSIFGSCIDGTDQLIRLDQYMKDETGRSNDWIVERCYMERKDIRKGLVSLLSKDAAAIEYKGIIFDEWTVDKENNGIWGEMCKCCAEKYGDLLKDELDENGGVGACSVKGCSVVGNDDGIEMFYVDFKPEFIRVLSAEQVKKLENNTSLDAQIQAANGRVTDGGFTPSCARDER